MDVTVKKRTVLVSYMFYQLGMMLLLFMSNSLCSSHCCHKLFSLFHYPTPR